MPQATIPSGRRSNTLALTIYSHCCRWRSVLIHCPRHTRPPRPGRCHTLHAVSCRYTRPDSSVERRDLLDRLGLGDRAAVGVSTAVLTF